MLSDKVYRNSYVENFRLIFWGGYLVVDNSELKENACCCEGESQQRTSAALMLVWLTMHMDVMHLVQDEDEMIQQELIPDDFGITGFPRLYIDDEQQEATENTIYTLDKSDEFAPVDEIISDQKLKWMKRLT